MSFSYVSILTVNEMLFLCKALTLIGNSVIGVIRDLLWPSCYDA